MNEVQGGGETPMTATEALMRNARNRGFMHNTEGITSVISKLEGLAEMLPGVTHAANALAGSGSVHATPYRSTAALNNAIEMLKEYRAITDATREASTLQSRREFINEAWDAGRRAGIEDEVKRAKEAKRGSRKH